MTDRRHDPAAAEGRRRNAPAMLRRSRPVDRNVIKTLQGTASGFGCSDGAEHRPVNDPKACAIHFAVCVTRSQHDGNNKIIVLQLRSCPEMKQRDRRRAELKLSTGPRHPTGHGAIHGARIAMATERNRQPLRSDRLPEHVKAPSLKAVPDQSRRQADTGFLRERRHTERLPRRNR